MDKSRIVLFVVLLSAVQITAEIGQPRHCIANGHKYPLGEPFSFILGCIEYHCQCHLSEAWDCPAQDNRNICPSTSARHPEEGPRNCHVDGKDYPGGQPFSFQRGCMEYQNCQCFRSGAWNCPASGSRDICKAGLAEPEPATHCDLHGAKYPAGSPFSFSQDCLQYSCQCYNNGSWNCPAQNTRNICASSTTPSPTPRHRACVVHGSAYPPGKSFSFTQECVEYNCQCHTDGRWTCPPQHFRNVCETAEQLSYTTVVTEPTPISCVVYGKHYPAGRNFSFTKNCVRYGCVCDKRGKWSCPAENSRNICPSATTASQQHVSSGRCRNCVFNGTTHRGHSRFRYTEGCIEHNCICNCEGKFSCPVRDQVDLCEAEKRRTQHLYRCRDCAVGGRTFSGHSLFELREGCVVRDCVCHCNGTSECYRDRYYYVCDTSARTRPSGSLGREGASATKAPRTTTRATRLATAATRTRPVTSRKPGTMVPPPQLPGRGRWFSLENRQVLKPYHETIGEAAVEFTSGRRGASGEGSVRTSLSGNEDEYDRKVFYSTNDTTYQRGINIRRGQNRPRNGTAHQTIVSGGRDSCKQCSAYGRLYRGNSQFRHVEGCYEYSCHCSCDGRWECPNENTRSICEPTRSCRDCLVDGQAYRGNTTFRYRRQCIEYHCVCNCNGQFECPSETAVDRCDARTASSCLNCNARGHIYKGNSRFTLQDGCIRYRCVCNCDGSWNCPGESATDTCNTCRDCRARGRNFRGNSTFTLQQGCIKYKCNCRCDGGWDCPSEGAVDTCNTDSISGCTNCLVKGKRHKGNSRFTLEEDCYRYRCTCKCDGSWTCPAETAERTCCFDCKVHGRKEKGNSNFELQKGCIKYKCFCKCDGGWNCPGETAIDTCCRDCNVRGQIKSGNSSFELQEGCLRYKCRCRCDGGWKCPAETAVDTCNTNLKTGCYYCDVKGRREEGHSRFTLQDGCYLYQCVCNCNGSWNCPADDAVNTCDTAVTRTCLTCNAKGQIYKGNSTFSFEENCYRFQCTCYCDGSWNCPGNTAENICDDGSKIETCVSCTVKGQEHRSNTDFYLTEGCFRFRCRCNCDGTWECPEDKSINVCKGQMSSDCQMCSVRGKTYKGNSWFTYEEGCFRYQCMCRCSGNWHCPKEKTVNKCNTESLSPCKTCSVKGKTYQGDSYFIYDQGCARFRCSCNCDGTWSCLLGRGRSTCQGYLSPRCRNCYVENREIRGNTTFEYSLDCKKYQCQCYCDGKFYCPADRAVDTCHAEKTDRCRDCLVNGQTFSGNSRFRYTLHCFQYECSCRCDGSWVCPPEQSVNICQSTVAPPACNICQVDGRYYEGGTAFKRQRDCLEYSCRCACNGTALCPAEEARNVCENDQPSECLDCVVGGKRYPGNSTFSQREACLEKECTCSCSGAWFCSAERTRNYCTDTAGSLICKPCTLHSNVYQGNTMFTISEECMEYRCLCGCDGRWSCLDSDTTNICQNSTAAADAESDKKGCTVNGLTYYSRTFHYVDDCKFYTCDCAEDGKYACPPEKTEVLC